MVLQLLKNLITGKGLTGKKSMQGKITTSGDEYLVKLHALWQITNTSKEDFGELYVPLFHRISEVLLTTTLDAHAEVLEILEDVETGAAIRRNWLLPGGRPGTNYRRYTEIYTYALVSAMAVEALRSRLSVLCDPRVAEYQNIESAPCSAENPAFNAPPDIWLASLAPAKGVEWLQDDPIVWRDWLAYFSDPEQSVMAQIAGRVAPPPSVQEVPREEIPAAQPVQKQASTSAQALVATIKAALEDRELPYNQDGAMVHVDREGRTFLEAPRIFEWYLDFIGDTQTDIKTLENQFKRLESIVAKEEGKRIWWGSYLRTDEKKPGYLIGDASVLWTGEAPENNFLAK